MGTSSTAVGGGVRESEEWQRSKFCERIASKEFRVPQQDITALTRKTTCLWSVRVRRSKESQGFFAAIDLTFTKIACLLSCIFSGSGKNPVFTAYRRLNIKLIKYLWSGIEAVITRTTRNRLTAKNRPWVRIPPAPPTRYHPRKPQSRDVLRLFHKIAGGI